MKKYFLIILLIAFNVISSKYVSAQADCRGTFKEYYLNSNNIRAAFYPRGNKFTNGSDGEFLVPYPSDKRLSTIFASAPWIGGFDDAGNLKLAVEAYIPPNIYDYSVGPLSYIGTQIDSICAVFDQAWSVYYEDIIRHKLDYEADFKIDDTISSIFRWPGRLNPHFKKYYGFELPNDVSGLAPFHDWNGNNIYDPENGDYPVVRLNVGGTEYIPDQILWMVFNDHETQVPLTTAPLRFEIQLTAFAFHCKENVFLNNTIFNSYRIVDRALIPIDSVLFGIWTDYDLGCSEDDFVGSDSTRNTEFVYNADIQDGDAGWDCTTGAPTYGAPAPVQSMTYLSHPMHSFISSASSGEKIGLYRMLSGRWPDGSPIRSSGNGQDTSLAATTKFLFHGDPRDTTSWSAINDLEGESDPRTISSVSLGRVEPGSIYEITTAYMFHHDPDKGHLDQITLMYNNVDSLPCGYNT